MEKIIVKQGDSIPGCVLLTGKFAGVRLPRSVKFYDTRYSNDLPVVKYVSQSGFELTLWGSERACFAEGSVYDFSTPTSVSTYTDALNCSDTALAEQIKSIRHHVARYWREYRKAKRRLANPGDGGTCSYRPYMVSLSNFGWSILAKSNDYVVSRFRD